MSWLFNVCGDAYLLSQSNNFVSMEWTKHEKKHTTRLNSMHSNDRTHAKRMIAQEEKKYFTAWNAKRIIVGTSSKFVRSFVAVAVVRRFSMWFRIWWVDGAFVARDRRTHGTCAFCVCVCVCVRTKLSWFILHIHAIRSRSRDTEMGNPIKYST